LNPISAVHIHAVCLTERFLGKLPRYQRLHAHVWQYSSMCSVYPEDKRMFDTICLLLSFRFMDINLYLSTQLHIVCECLIQGVHIAVIYISLTDFRIHCGDPFVIPWVKQL
jgi:hypothetical protein